MRTHNSISVALAERLTRARQAAGFSSTDAAAIRLHVHPEAYAQHEKGQVAVKSAELRRYAEVFGVSAGWLGTGIGAGPRKVG